VETDKTVLMKVMSVESNKNCFYRRLSQTSGTVVFAVGCNIGREGKTFSTVDCVI
jgi:hypothetical protein